MDKSKDAFKHFKIAFSQNINIAPAWYHIGLFYLYEFYENPIEEDYYNKAVNALRRAMQISEDIGMQFVPIMGELERLHYFLDQREDVINIPDDKILDY